MADTVWCHLLYNATKHQKKKHGLLLSLNGKILKLKGRSSFSVPTNTFLSPPSASASPTSSLLCGRPISSVTSGLWQGGLVMATHSCNMDGAFHISVVNKRNRSRSFSISTSHDLPTAWQRRREKGGERGEGRRLYWPCFSNGCSLTVWQWPEPSFGKDHHSIFIHRGERKNERQGGGTERRIVFSLMGKDQSRLGIPLRVKYKNTEKSFFPPLVMREFLFSMII